MHASYFQSLPSDLVLHVQTFGHGWCNHEVQIEGVNKGYYKPGVWRFEIDGKMWEYSCMMWSALTELYNWLIKYNETPRI